MLEQNNGSDSLRVLPNESANEIVFYTHPLEWQSELWTTDILYYLFENGKYPIVAPPPDIRYNSKQLSGQLDYFFQLPILPDLPVMLIAGGDCANALQPALEGL